MSQLGTGCFDAQPVGRPNVIVVCIDSLRADRLAPYGGADTNTRTFDAIAAEGVVFENAFSVASWTKPSVASLLTGLYPSQHGLIAGHGTRADLLPDATTTLAETLHEAGYRTAAFVDNIHLQRAQSALDQGFEVYAEELGSAREIINGFAAWVAREEPRPFFAYLHVLDPHWPYTPLPPPAGRALAAGVALRRSQWDLTGSRWPLLRNAVNEHGLRLTREEIAAVTALYDGEIYDVDAALASLLELLRARGLLARTLLVVTADHGEGLLDHGRLDHGYGPYDELLRIPLLLRFPDGAEAGRRVSQPVQIVDVAPTIVEYAGIRMPALGGRSLLAAVAGRDADEVVVIAEEVHGAMTMTALRTARYKYLRTEDAAPTTTTAASAVPVDLRPGIRVRMEGIGARSAFVADEVKRVAPGDDDCEVTAPIETLADDATRVEVLGFDADVSGLSEKDRAVLARREGKPGGGSFVWAHVQGIAKDGVLTLDDADGVDAASPEAELEGIVESIDFGVHGASLVVCGMRVLLDEAVRWKGFGKLPEPPPSQAAPAPLPQRFARSSMTSRPTLASART